MDDKLPPPRGGWRLREPYRLYGRERPWGEIHAARCRPGKHPYLESGPGCKLRR